MHPELLLVFKTFKSLPSSRPIDFIVATALVKLDLKSDPRFEDAGCSCLRKLPMIIS
jgi:hypothetical protein